ncbi:hypothetical protein ACOQ1M_004699 [Salmonella enterica subsp. enterica serovar Infantis]|nr:hypothetical protein [Salmonella enterica subsp. enterica serovar Kentucky]
MIIKEQTILGKKFIISIANINNSHIADYAKKEITYRFLKVVRLMVMDSDFKFSRSNQKGVKTLVKFNTTNKDNYSYAIYFTNKEMKKHINKLIENSMNEIIEYKRGEICQYSKNLIQ